MMVDAYKWIKFYIVLICVVCYINTNYITKMTIVFPTSSISLENVDQLSLIINNKIIENPGFASFFLSIWVTNN
jgi:hypothetical protein